MLHGTPDRAVTYTELRELGDPKLVSLGAEEALALQSTGALTVEPAGKDHWSIAAKAYVGVLRVGAHQFVLQPKINISRIVFLMSYARRPGFWREDPVELDAELDLPEALAHAFTELAQHAVGQGLLKGYQTIDDTLTVLRGRIREADQFRRHLGRALPLEVRYDDYTVDIAENQLLLAATLKLLPLLGPGHPMRGPLQRLRVVLADVSDTRRRPRPQWQPSRLNERYQRALALAELILDGWSFEQRMGNVTVTGYLLNMATIFEDFVGAALRAAFKPLGGTFTSQYRTYLDEERSVPIRPDYVWSVNGVPRVVADAKYKAERPDGYPNADLYQMLAYATVLGLGSAHLIYALGNESSAKYTISSADVTVTAHAVNLGLPPSELLLALAGTATEMSAEASS